MIHSLAGYVTCMATFNVIETMVLRNLTNPRFKTLSKKIQYMYKSRSTCNVLTRTRELGDTYMYIYVYVTVGFTSYQKKCPDRER
jgi:hypothetical protein